MGVVDGGMLCCAGPADPEVRVHDRLHLCGVAVCYSAKMESVMRHIARMLQTASSANATLRTSAR